MLSLIPPNQITWLPSVETTLASEMILFTVSLPQWPPLSIYLKTRGFPGLDTNKTCHTRDFKGPIIPIRPTIMSTMSESIILWLAHPFLSNNRSCMTQLQAILLVYPMSKILQPSIKNSRLILFLNGSFNAEILLTERAFFTPNMKNDGHDTDINFAANWTRTHITFLLANSTFNSNNTLILVTFDESETYTIKNHVWALLLGSAIPEELRGTTDNTFYTHYSCLSTVENNWDLYNLGRGDVNTNYSNVFQFVADKTGFQNVIISPENIPYLNFTASGYFDTSNPGPIPAVLNVPGAGGKGLLPSLKGVNGSAIPPPSTASPGPSTSISAAVRQFSYSFDALVGCICVFVAVSIGMVV